MSVNINVHSNPITYKKDHILCEHAKNEEIKRRKLLRLEQVNIFLVLILLLLQIDHNKATAFSYQTFYFLGKTAIQRIGNESAKKGKRTKATTTTNI